MDILKKGRNIPAYPLQQITTGLPQPQGLADLPQQLKQDNVDAAVEALTSARRFGKNDNGLLYAIIASLIAFFFGFWIPLTCTIAAIFLSIKAQKEADSGDVENMRKHQKRSLILSTVGIVLAVVLDIAVIVAIILDRTIPSVHFLDEVL